MKSPLKLPNKKKTTKKPSQLSTGSSSTLIKGSLTKEAILENPSAIGEAIVQLGKEITQSKESLDIIKSRNFFKQLTNNNTRDLAEVMLKQNNAMSTFLYIIKSVMLLCDYNETALLKIMNSIEKREIENHAGDREFTTIAREMISEGLETSRRVTNQGKSIGSLKIICIIASCIAVLSLVVSIVSMLS